MTEKAAITLKAISFYQNFSALSILFFTAFSNGLAICKY